MNLEELREYCLRKPGVTESMPFGDTTLVFKVGDKIFALTSLDAAPLSVNLKCDPERAVELREQYDAVRPGYHMNKKHWNTVLVNGTVRETALREWIDHSYDLVFTSLPKSARQAIEK
jgi:predicted DNA-binding protein (MmcQ/YjbR family)